MDTYPFPLPIPVAHPGAGRLEQKIAEEAAIASLGLFHYAGGRKQNKPSYSYSLNLMALTLKSPSTARYSIFSMPSRLGNWNSTSATFTVASVSLKEMQICREPQEGRVTHHRSQASPPHYLQSGCRTDEVAAGVKTTLASSASSLPSRGMEGKKLVCSAPRSAPCLCNEGMRQTWSESQVSVLINCSYLCGLQRKARVAHLTHLSCWALA